MAAPSEGSLDRRAFLRSSAAVAAVSAATTVGLAGAERARGGTSTTWTRPSFRWLEATMAELQAAMASGELTALELTRCYLARIEALDWQGPRVNSVIETNPDAEAIARDLDRERAQGHVRGPLHGIPIVLKDSIATVDRMETTAGSLALVGSRFPRDSGVARTLRDASAILLAKTNMSEWNAFRGWPLHGGWCGRAGIGLNPYALRFSTGDSSSGSAAAVAAGAVGLETYGSIVMPASLCGIVGLKPTLGLCSRSGTIPISFTRDTTGPMARTVADVATLLGGLVGVDPLDDTTAASAHHLHRDYRKFLDPDGLRGARIGVWQRKDLFRDPGAEVIESVIPVLRDLGAVVIDSVKLPEWQRATGLHTEVMFREFRHGIRRYLAQLSGTSIRTLSDVIAFNEQHAAAELTWHNQGTLEAANEEAPLSDPRYAYLVRRSRKLGRAAFEVPMREHRLDAIFCPTFFRPWPINLLDGDPTKGNGAAGPANAAGYPHITVPAGSLGPLPIGASFMARAWQEPRLIKYAYAFEQAVGARRPPEFLADYGVADFVPR